MTNELTKKPKVILTDLARKKIRYYVTQCENEISGLGKVKLIKPTTSNGVNCFLVQDVEIFEQKVSAAHSTIDEDALAKFLFEKIRAKEKLSEWRFWWHSHAKMEVFFSGTDTGTIEASTEFPWLLSFVTNHNGDIKCRLDVFDPVRHTVEDLEMAYLESEDLELKELCNKDIKTKVSTFHESHHSRYDDHEFDRDYPAEDDDQSLMGFLTGKKNKGKYKKKTYLNDYSDTSGKKWKWSKEKEDFVPIAEGEIVDESLIGFSGKRWNKDTYRWEPIPKPGLTGKDKETSSIPKNIEAPKSQ